MGFFTHYLKQKGNLECNLFQVWKNGEKDFTSKYLNLLKSGGIHHHKEALSPFNLDASHKKFWNKGLDNISELIDELENL